MHVHEMLASAMVCFSLASHNPALQDQQFLSLSMLATGYRLISLGNNLGNIIIFLQQSPAQQCSVHAYLESCLDPQALAIGSCN